MTTKTEFYICNAVKSDFEDIYGMLGYLTTKFFGHTKRKNQSPEQLFRNYCTHRILLKQSETSKGILGYAEFHNFPKIEALPKNCWMYWLQHHYCVQLPMSTSNVLFFNFFMYHKDYEPDIMLTVLSEVFFRENEVRYIITVEMPKQKYRNKQDIPSYDMPWAHGKTYFPIVYNVTTCKNVQRIHVFARDNLVSKMRYRLALPEDNDDIVAIVDTDRPDVRENLGDFYIAEELLRSDEDNNKFIVTEVNNATSGFIGLNHHVDVIRVVENFYCEAFGNLIRLSRYEPFNNKVIRVTVCDQRPFSWMFTHQAIEDLFYRAHLGKYMIHGQTSSYTLNSQYNLHVQSSKGRIRTTNERYYLCEEYLKKIFKVSEKLNSTDYFANVHTKLVRLYYNVSEDDIGAEDDETLCYKGSNVFAIQLFGLGETHDVRRIYRFLATSFNAFPDRDYCIFSMPPNTVMTKCLCELLKYFYLVKPRPGCRITDRVFITHRSTIYGEISVHRVRPEDRDHIEKILLINNDNAIRRPTDSSILRESLKEETHREAYVVCEILDEVLINQFSEYDFLTIRCGNSANPVNENAFVGFVILRKMTKLYKLRLHYILPKETLENVGEIIVLRLHPFYHFKSDTVFRELARNTDYYEFYYIAPTKSTVKPLPNDLAINMQPIEPRRIKKFNYIQQLFEDKPHTTHRQSIDKLKFEGTTFEIFHHNLKPSKFFANHNKIVIIGFSNLCKAFLRQLLFSWNTVDLKMSDMYCCLPRANVTVIAPPGVVEAEYDSDFECSNCNIQYECWVNQDNGNDFINDCIRRMDFRKYVKFINHHIQSINRESRNVVLTNNCQVFYDTLIFLNDTKYGPPKAINAPYELPPNYAHFNHRLERIIFYHKLNILIQENFIPRIVIYGYNLQTFEFINFLLKHGVRGSSIFLVTPYYLSDQKVQVKFNNPYTDNKIQRILLEIVSDSGVHVYEHYNFSHWTRFHEELSLASVAFKSYSNPDDILQIDCEFFISYKEKHINMRIVDILNAADIKLKSENNRVYVNERFQTNDPAIYALGKFIKHTEKVNHQYKYVNNEEATDKLLNILKLKGEDDTMEYDVKFNKPVFFQAHLPMKHFIVKVVIPKRYLANHLTNDYQYSMTTYKNETFTRVRLNEHFIVEEILCVTTAKMSFDFLQNICGKHESLLNNLMARWYTQDMDNFISFFQEPWTELLLHDAYVDLHEYIKTLIKDPAESCLNLSIERTHRKQMLKKLALRDGLTRMAERGVIEFLRKYREDFSNLFVLPEDYPSINI